MSETETVDQYDFWRRRLAGERINIHDGEPQAGFYRLKHDDGSSSAVAYWFASDGSVRCRINDKSVKEQMAMERWPWASKNPVTHEAYLAGVAGQWPDENAAVIGHNQAPPDDSPEGIAEAIANLAREAEKLIKAGAAQNEADADQAANVANTLGTLEKKIAGLHKVEKEPHLEAGRVCDRKWFTLRDKAADIKARLKAIVVTPYLTKKAADTQKANVAAISAGTAPEALPQTRLTAGSTTRSMGLRTHTSAEVVDWDALLAALKDHPSIREAAQSIANASAKAGVALPGTKIVKEQRAA